MPRFLICGAGGIGTTAAVIARAWAPDHVRDATSIVLLDRDAERLDAAQRLLAPVGEPRTVKTDVLASRAKLTDAVAEADVVLDCLEGGDLTVACATAAIERCTPYVNLTEHVVATRAILELTRRYSGSRVVLQTGLAPGYINVLAMHLVANYDAVTGGHGTIEHLGLRVGALSATDVPETHYAWTWSPAGVATEYVEDSIVLRDGKIAAARSLSERDELRIASTRYEIDLTSGGVADLPEALAGRVARLDYKTIRYPGHYAWVDRELEHLRKSSTGHSELARTLQDRMMAAIHSEDSDDRVLIQATLSGIEHGCRTAVTADIEIRPSTIAGIPFRAIQTTTAAPLVECAFGLLDGGFLHDVAQPVTQSRVNPIIFLNGAIVRRVYGPCPIGAAS